MGMERSIEFAVIGGYLVILILIALAFRRLNKNISDYFRNGCRGTWWLIGMSAFMTVFSAWTFTGAAGVAFLSGWSVLIIFGTNVVAFLINAIWFAPWFRQLRAITPPEIIERRFGVGTQQFYGWMTALFQLVMSALHLYGLAIFSAAIFGIEVQTVILVIGIVVLFYSLIGGSWAIMATDFIQSIILMPMTILVAILCLQAVGGVGAFFDLIQQRGLTEDYRIFMPPKEEFDYQFTYVWAAAMFLKNFTVFSSMRQAPRYFAAKDGKEASKGALLAAGLMAVGCLIWFIPPMTARLLFEQSVLAVDAAKPAESAYAIASLKVLPLGLTGVMVVAIFSATMSSMDTGLNRNAAIFTNDIYPAIARWLGLEPMSDKGLLRLGQVFTMLMGVSIIGIAMYFSSSQDRGVFEHMLTVGAVLGVPMTTPLLLGLLIKRVPGWAALFSVACAAVSSTIGVAAGSQWLAQIDAWWVSMFWLDHTWHFQERSLVNMGVGIAAFVGTMPFWSLTTSAYKEKAAAFFETMYRPVNFEEEVGQANDEFQSRLIGGFCSVVGGCVCLLMFLPNTWGIDGRLGILLVGGSVGIVGAVLTWSGFKKRQISASKEVPDDVPMTSADEP